MSTNNLAKKRWDWIDYTKGLAILGILLFHFFQNYPDRIPLVSLLDSLGAKVGYAAVDIFFVMAGFNTSYALAAIAKKNQLSEITTNWIPWLQKRLVRLYPTYILAVLVTLLLYSLFKDIEIKSITDGILIFFGVASYKTFRVFNPGFWFFFVILQAYLVTPLIFKVCQNNPTKILLLGIALGTFNKLLCLIFIQDSDTFMVFLQNNFLGSYFFQLCLGLYWGFIYNNHNSFRKVDFTVTSIIFVLGLGLYAALAVAGVDIIYMLGFDMLFTPFFFIACYWLFDKGSQSKLLTKGLSLLSLMGIYSYQIYLVHQPLYFVLLPYLTKQINLNSYLKILPVLLITIAVLTVYVIAFIYLDNFLSKIFGKLLKKQA
ncbi:acyltransferase family protein [Aerosakkonemataceae cyanobacterium BLCC-F154]|uniref:Acyltransferase family protein n=1 Tax=Floridaenema fluviatile BLCC-F154 TaxID=3153640 RepID=A0ABV4YJW2_9CYAN